MRRLRWYHWFLMPIYVPFMIFIVLALVIADAIDPEPDMDKLYPQRKKP